VLIETFIRKQLRLKAHRVIKVETNEESMIIEIDRLGNRRLRCGVCRKPCRGVARDRAAFWSELEDGGRGCAAGGALWLAASEAGAGTHDWHR